MKKAKIKILIISLMLSVMTCVSVFPMAGAVDKDATLPSETEKETVLTEEVTEDKEEAETEKAETEDKEETEETTEEKETKPAPKKPVYTERDKIIDYALSEVGYTQKNGYNKFSAEFGSGYMAWCNYFVVWCAKKAGVSPQTVTGTSSYNGNCYIYMNGLRNQGRFFVNDGSYTPKKGDLVFYNSTKSTSGSTHIGFVLEADANTVTTVEGNVTVNGTRGVGRNVRPRYSYVGNMIIIGFGVPAYDNEEIPKVKIKKSADTFPENSKNKKPAKKELIDVKKFETNVSPAERMELIESIRKAGEKTETVCRNIDFVSVVKLSYCNVPECNSKICICDKVK